MKTINLVIILLLIVSLIGCSKAETKPQIQPVNAPEVKEPLTTQEQTGLDDDLQDLEEDDAEDLDISEEDFSI